jgi:hypothetical protein
VCRATAQAFSRRIPTAKALINSYGIFGGQNRNGACFLGVLPVSLPIIRCTDCSTIIAHRYLSCRTSTIDQ